MVYNAAVMHSQFYVLQKKLQIPIISATKQVNCAAHMYVIMF